MLYWYRGQRGCEKSSGAEKPVLENLYEGAEVMVVYLFMIPAFMLVLAGMEFILRKFWK